MKLYKFRKVDTFSLSGLSNNTLWFSNIDSFNDPFEGNYILDKKLSETKWQEVLERFHLKSAEEVGNDEQEAMFEALGVTDSGLDKKDLLNRMMERDIKEALIETIHSSKVFSMSLSSDECDPIYENLMWSHYSDGLRGFCLVFDKDRLLAWYYEKGIKVRPAVVEYTDKPLVISFTDFIDSSYFLDQKPDYDLIENVTRTISMKSSSWSYENELRLLSKEDFHAHHYPPEFLIEIVIGEKMPEDQKNMVIDIAKTSNPNIEIKQAKLKYGSYDLEILDY
ncbi:MAG: DUF2971 domain-containing protein [Colwellia sp.]|nr:DUF2971 domain-containing protein [Colwellia sp.]